MTFENDAELVKLFLAEAKELAEGIASAVMELETRFNEDTLNTAFRLAHNLKGTSGTVGFANIETLVHAIEDVLSRARREKRSPTKQETSLILKAADKLLDLITAADPSKPLDNEAQKLVSQLRELAGTKEESTTTQEPQPTPKPTTKRQESVPSAPAKSFEDKQASAKSKTAAKPEPSADEPQKPQEASKPAGGPTKGSTVSASAAEEFMRLPRSRIERLLEAAEDLVELKIFNAGMVARWSFFLEWLEVEFRRLKKFYDHIVQIEPETASEIGGLLRRMQDLIISAARQQREIEQEASSLGRNVDYFIEELRSLNVVPLMSIVPHLKRVVRDAAERTGKEATLVARVGNIQADRALVEALKSPLTHILRNAVDHGLESPEERDKANKPALGIIRLDAQVRGNTLIIEVADDGRGIDFEAIRRKAVERGLVSEDVAAKLTEDRLKEFLFLPGFSTAKRTGKLSGRGVGLDVVKAMVDRRGGRLDLSTIPGYGTTITIEVPLSVESRASLVFEVVGKKFALPIQAVRRVVGFSASEVETVQSAAVLRIDEVPLPVVELAPLLGLPSKGAVSKREWLVGIVLGLGGRSAVFVVDKLLGETELVVKPLGKFLEGIEVLAGVSLISSGELILVLEADKLLDAVGEKEPVIKVEAEATRRQRTILVVDDSLTTRALEQHMLEQMGFRVLTASDGEQALKVLEREHVDLVLTDVQMPKMDGFKLTKQIKHDPRFKDLPVVLLTALDSKADLEAGLESGADAYMVKHKFSKTELLETIERLL